MSGSPEPSDPTDPTDPTSTGHVSFCQFLSPWYAKFTPERLAHAGCQIDRGNPVALQVATDLLPVRGRLHPRDPQPMVLPPAPQLLLPPLSIPLHPFEPFLLLGDTALLFPRACLGLGGLLAFVLLLGVSALAIFFGATATLPLPLDLLRSPALLHQSRLSGLYLNVSLLWFLTRASFLYPSTPRLLAFVPAPPYGIRPPPLVCRLHPWHEPGTERIGADVQEPVPDGMPGTEIEGSGCARTRRPAPTDRPTLPRARIGSDLPRVG